MAAQDSTEFRTTEVSSDDAANEVLAPATPGAEVLGGDDPENEGSQAN